MAINIDKLLTDALLEISEQKQLKKVTVQDIMDYTGVSRQTFYNHYKDKFDLINDTFLKLIIGEGQLDENNSLYGYISKALQRFVSHKKFVAQAEEMQGQDSLIDYMVWHNYNNYRTLFLKNHDESEISPELDFAMHFNSYGVAYMHIKWIKEGMKISIDNMANFEINSLPEIMKSFLIEDGVLEKA